MKTNIEILTELHQAKNHSHNTIRKYKYAVDKYCKYNDNNLYNLLKEAEEEEEKGIRWKNRKLKKRLIGYRQYLIEKYTKHTVESNLKPILVIYRFHEIELQPLPKINMQKPQVTTYQDLPDKEVIRSAVNIANPLMKAIILFMSSSGTARAETLNLTIQDYINATIEYHQSRNIYEVINRLKEMKDVVPTFNILRLKTNKFYTTYCSPEAVRAINHYLLQRKDPLTPESPLFKIGETQFIVKFEELNDELNLGNVGAYRRLRSHMLRKFHASQLYNDGLSLDKVNDLQGKAKNRTDSAYFMINPEDLRLEYIQHLPCLMIGKEVEKITIKSKEFRELENELKNKTEEVESVTTRLDNIEKILGDLGIENIVDKVKKE
ncbi:MAG: tyrosine-type recombinase/integrase [Methanobrevibacter sp.]|nr:tyrosine-type recombinase/integrase [Methanobrevibacter sp.]